jgi:hypothetical protein
MKNYYLVYNRFMSRECKTLEEASRVAKLNACAILKVGRSGDYLIADYRTDESENDERG